MLYLRKRIIVGEGLNCVTSPAAWQVDPLVSSSFSSSTTSRQPALARWYTTLVPVMPPPMTTARACSIAVESYARIVRTIRALAATSAWFVRTIRESRHLSLWKWLLFCLRQEEQQQSPGDGRHSAQLDRPTQPGGRGQQTHRLQSRDATDGSGQPQRRLRGRAGARRKQLTGPRAENRKIGRA